LRPDAVIRALRRALRAQIQSCSTRRIRPPRLIGRAAALTRSGDSLPASGGSTGLVSR
jgi:hypothetical protein